jgi:glycosyltransferase involved in cell wall biosynthesis
MRILALSSWWPEPADNGSRLRIAHLLEALAQEHEIHLVALAQGSVHNLQRTRTEDVCASVYAVPQRAYPRRRSDLITSLWQAEPVSVRRTWNPEFSALVQARAAAIQPDVVCAFQLGVAPYACSIMGIPRVLEELEFTYMREQYTHQPYGWQRLRAWLTWQKHQSYVARLLRHFSLCTVASAGELKLLQSLAPQTTELAIIPNGAEVREYTGDWGDPEPDTLIYPGALSFTAKNDAMSAFLSSSFPLIRAKRPGVRLRITGRADPEQRAALPTVMGVEFTGYLDDVRPIVAQSWCEVVPLRIGGGTRLKVLEALALGTPVISTSKGIEGLQLDANRHILVADTPTSFVQATLRLLADPGLRARLAAAGRQVVRERYDWQTIGQQLNQIITETVARHQHAEHQRA